MRREWTKKEERYIVRNYLRQPVKLTAQKLNRTESSVKHKAERLGLNHYMSGLNAKTLAKCFNSDVSVVIRWIKKFNLPCEKIVCETQKRYIIDDCKFWHWAEKHKEIINWSKYDRRSLSPEPDWLDNVIKNYTTVRSRKRYTEYEIVRIKNLLHKEKSYREISNEMGRSYDGIRKLCRNLN